MSTQKKTVISLNMSCQIVVQQMVCPCDCEDCTPPVGEPPVGTPPVGSTPDPNPPQVYERHIFLSPMSDIEGGANWLAVWKPLYDQARQSGLTGATIVVSWFDVEPSPGTFSYTVLDQHVTYLKSLGMKYQVLLDTSRDANPTLGGALDYTDFYEDIQKKQDGTDNVYLGWRVHHSLSDTASNALAAAFVQAVCTHLAADIAANTCVAVGFRFGDNGEFCFSGTPSDYLADYSATTQTGFRYWLTAKYGAIGNLNAAWDTAYANYSEVYAPCPANNCIGVASDFNWGSSPEGIDWFKFRTYQLRSYFDLLAAAAKAGAAATRTLLIFPALGLLHACAIQGHTNWANIGQAADVLYSSDGTDTNNARQRKIAANEAIHGTFGGRRSEIEMDTTDLGIVGGGTSATFTHPHLLRDVGREFFQKGGWVLNLALFAVPAQLQAVEPFITTLRAEFITAAPPQVNRLGIPTFAVNASNFLYNEDSIVQSWIVNGQSQMININLIDNL